MPSVAAGVIIATPPGGRRGSIAVRVEFLFAEDVILAVFEPEADPDPEPEAVLEALWL